MKSFLSSFRYPGYRILWITTISLIGGVQMSMASRALLADDLTNSAFITGIVTMGFAPALLIFSVFGGVIGDQFENRRILQTVQTGFLASAVLTWLLIELNLITWQFLFLTSFFQGILFSFQMPARYSFIPKLVPENKVGNGVALLSTGIALASVFSGSAVGFLYGVFGPSGVFLVISLIQITTLVLTFLLPKTEVSNSSSDGYLLEMKNSYLKNSYLKEVTKYCPQITSNDLLPYPAGVRAQAISYQGKLIDDFVFVNSNLSFNVCNAPSPAATSAIPIGEHICNEIEKTFN